MELLHQLVEILRDTERRVPLVEDTIHVHRDPVAHKEPDFSFLGMSLIFKCDDLNAVCHLDACAPIRNEGKSDRWALLPRTFAAERPFECRGASRQSLRPLQDEIRCNSMIASIVGGDVV
jgi:hypothetical protein